MNLDQPLFDNAEVVQATGLTVATLQTWANRGVLSLSENQRNPGPGQRRLYTALDVARITVIRSLIAHGLTASVAGRIALRLERGWAEVWRQALQSAPNHIRLIVVDDFEVAWLQTNDDFSELSMHVAALEAEIEAGPIGAQTKTRLRPAIYDIGIHVSPAMQRLRDGASAGSPCL